jgi:hypothetical protein
MLFLVKIPEYLTIEALGLRGETISFILLGSRGTKVVIRGTKVAIKLAIVPLIQVSSIILLFIMQLIILLLSIKIVTPYSIFIPLESQLGGLYSTLKPSLIGFYALTNQF